MRKVLNGLRGPQASPKAEAAYFQRVFKGESTGWIALSHAGSRQEQVNALGQRMQKV